MLDTLFNIYEKQNQLPLTFVSYALFEGDPNFITAIEMRFASEIVTFRAMSDFDTISVQPDEVELEAEESLIDVSDHEPWSLCKGAHFAWLWRLTNQQGYDDGIRLEFSKYDDENFRLVLEFIVMASEIQIFLPRRIESIKH